MLRAKILPCLMLASLALAGPAAAVPAKGHSGPPPTLKRPVTDKYGELAVTDDYRWLEDFSSPEVHKWSDAQNVHARARLDHLPSVAPIRKRVEELEKSASPDYFGLDYRGGTLFAMKAQPPKQQPYLVTLKSADDAASERAVVDPNKLNPKGTTAIDFFAPSVDGKLVAVSISEGGSEYGTARVFESATGRELGDAIPHVNGGTAGGSVAWNSSGTGFYYTRYPRQGERPAADLDFYQQVYFHKLGDSPDRDVYCIGKEFPKIAEIALSSTDDGRYILANVFNGDGGEHAFYLLSPDKGWTQLTRFEDKIVVAAFGPDDALYFLSRAGAPHGKVLRMPLGAPDLSGATTVVPESPAAVQGFTPTSTLLYVEDLVGGPSQVRIFDHSGGEKGKIPLQGIAAAGDLVRLDQDDVLYRTSTYVDPPAWYRYSASDGKALRTALFRTSPADFSDCEVVREWATSKDGTKIPINIIRKKGTRMDGRNPTLLTGYGGYGVNMTPAFSSGRRAWIEQGGVWAQANIRGGGEFGDEWHTAGNLTRKQNVFDDFAACGQYLIDAKYTCRDKLAIEGGSNGGLLMGATLVQHPGLMKAVITHVGLYDMLRVELSPNGEFNTTEFGTVKDPEQFKALYAYSPYHHVVEGTPYPAVLFLTGQNDPRVDPANSRKMAARLQAATSSTDPILLRTSSSSGHGIGSSLNERIGQQVDVLAFLFDELKVKYKPVNAKIQRKEKPRP